MEDLPDFTEVRELGRGAQGRVVLARHDQSGQRVAIKYVDAGSLGPERDMLLRVRSEHVVRLYEYRETALVLEYVEGCTLKDVLAEHGDMPVEAALYVLKGSLLGLAAAHHEGVVHRDYKPANVLIRPDGLSKLTDFGIAVEAGHGAGAGTLDYMPPEQWRGAVTPAADVYAATCVFFECATGRRPYRSQLRGEARKADLFRQHAEAPVPASEVPEGVRGLVLSGMAKDPSGRPAGALEFVQELERTAEREYGPDWEARGRNALSVATAALVAAMVAGQVAGGTVAGAGTTVKTALISTAAGKAAVVVAGIAVVGATTTAVVVKAQPESTRPVSAPFAFTEIDVAVAIPAAGRADIQVAADGIPQVSGGDKAGRETINALLRAPVDREIDRARAQVAKSKDLAKPGCEGVGLSVKVVRGMAGPKLISVGYEFVSGFECATEKGSFNESVTVDVEQAAVIPQDALFKAGAVPALGKRLSWPRSGVGCTDMSRLSPADLSPAGREYRPTRISLVFQPGRLRVSKAGFELGCDVTATSVPYGEISDLLRPDVLSKAEGAPVPDRAALIGPRGKCPPVSIDGRSVRVTVTRGRVLCATAAKVVQRDLLLIKQGKAEGSGGYTTSGKWVCGRHQRHAGDLDGGRTCENQTVAFIHR